MSLCKFGFHDYETLERITKIQLEHNIRHHQRYLDECKKIKDGRPIPPEGPPLVIKSDLDLDKRYVKKICLRCGKKIDEITPLKEKLELKMKSEISREDRAMELWNKE